MTLETKKICYIFRHSSHTLSPFLHLFGKAVYHKCTKSCFNYFYSICTTTLDTDIRMNTITYFILAELLHGK